MARKARPWFRRSDGWWYVMSGKQQKLAHGRKNKQAALERWHELMLERASNPRWTAATTPWHPSSTCTSPLQTRLGLPELPSRRTRYFQRVCGSPRLPAGLGMPADPPDPVARLQDGMGVRLDAGDGHQASCSGRSIGPCGSGSLSANPFFGVTDSGCGEPRRPMTDEEFRSTAPGDGHAGARRAKAVVIPANVPRRARGSAKS